MGAGDLIVLVAVVIDLPEILYLWILHIRGCSMRSPRTVSIDLRKSIEDYTNRKEPRTFRKEFELRDKAFSVAKEAADVLEDVVAVNKAALVILEKYLAMSLLEKLPHASKDAKERADLLAREFADLVAKSTGLKA